MRKTWEFGPSLIMAKIVDELEAAGCFPKGKGRPLGNETTPRPEVNEAIVFKDFFACGLRFPPVPFLCSVLESFNVQLHHLTLNGILCLSKFCWACESYCSEPDLDTFCAYYELQRQPKKIKIGNNFLEAQFGHGTGFM